MQQQAKVISIAIAAMYTLGQKIGAAERLTMEHFIVARLADRQDLQETALALFHRGESDGTNIIAELIEKRLSSTGVREDG